MNLGKLDRRIVIEQYSETRTTSGAVNKVWSTLGEVWAKVDWKSGGEGFEAKQEQGFNNVEFMVRFCGLLNANEKQRIFYNDEYFDILYVNEIDRRQYYKIVTKRKTVWQEQ